MTVNIDEPMKPKEIDDTSSKMKESEKALDEVEPLTADQLDLLKKRGMYTYKGLPKKAPLLLPPEELGQLYQDLKDDKTHEDYCYCPSCLYQFYKLTHKNCRVRKEKFFFGWILFIILTSEVKKNIREEYPLLIKEEYFLLWWLYYLTAIFKVKIVKRPFKYNWDVACDLMFKIMGNEIENDTKYLYKYYSNEKRNQIYKIGSKYIKIVIEAFYENVKNDIYFNHPRIKGKYWFDIRFASIKKYFESEWLLTIKIHTHLKKVKKSTLRKLERKYNKKLKDLIPCLMFLKNKGEIFWNVENKSKEIFYIGKNGKKIDKVSPADFFLHSSLYALKREELIG